MIRLLRFLVTGYWHIHKWEIEHVSCGECLAYVQRCAICGKMRRFRVRT